MKYVLDAEGFIIGTVDRIADDLFEARPFNFPWQRFSSIGYAVDYVRVIMAGKQGNQAQTD